jgi:DNA-binding transcriptional LysR family regulator
MKDTPLSFDRIALMQTFVRIVEAGSLSAAAVQLGTSQPTVSRRLKALEQAFGLRLLRRSTHAMTLTEDGRRCYEQAKDLLARWQEMEAGLRGVEDEPEGLLRVVVPHAFGQSQLLVPLIDYLRAYPRVSVDWLLHDRTPDFIAEGIDCAIRIGALENEGVVATQIGQVPRIVVAAPALLEGRPLPQAPEALAELPWLAMQTFYRDEVVLHHAGDGRLARFAIRPRLSTDSLYPLREAALAGLGAALVSAWVVREDIAQGRLVHLVPAWRPTPLPAFVVYPQARYQPAKLRRFIELMRAANAMFQLPAP